jgi:hypothetical protein
MPARRDRTCRIDVRFDCVALPGAGIAGGALMAPIAAPAQMPPDIAEKIGARR